MTRILVFSPYQIWTIHTIYEKTIARACQVRGASVDYLLCDGLLPECDQHWDSKENSPRPFDLCQRCQSTAKAEMQDFGIPFRWLGDFVGSAARTQAFAWAQGLIPSEFDDALFEGAPVGQWVRESVISYFRQFPPDLNNWHAVNVYRGFLYSAAIVLTGLRSYLAENVVEAALLFNGRQSVTRVAFEVFREQGIRVLTHERAEYSRGHINVKPNAHCMSLRPFLDLWSQWAEVPLTRASLEAVHQWLIQRQSGVNLAWIPFNKSSQPVDSLRQILALSGNKRLWVLFTSSTDETAGDSQMKGPFESQAAWVGDVVRWAAEQDGIELVIKVHPNLGGNRYIGKATGELQMYENMKQSLPSNVRIALPQDNVNSYSLANEADVGLTFGSIMGIEMAMLGKPVLLASRTWYEDATRIIVVRSRESLPQMLEECSRAAPDREIRREAFRIAYCYMHRLEMQFPLITVLDIFDAKLNYRQDEDLAVGRDPSLDRICGYLMEGEALFECPTPEERSRSTADEDAFFDHLESTNPNGTSSDARSSSSWDSLHALGTANGSVEARLAAHESSLRKFGKSIRRSVRQLQSRAIGALRNR